MKILTALILLAATSSAHADGYAGILLGPSFVNQDVGTRFVVGGRAGIRLTSWFSLGFYGTWNSLVSISGTDENGSYGEDASQVILALEPNFYPVPDLPFYLGLKIGAALTSASVSTAIYAGNASETNFAIGPATGADFLVGSNLALGAEFNAIFINIEGESFVPVNLLATLTYHF